MKNYLLCTFVASALCGCTIGAPGEGSVSGKLVDVSWEGLIFKSCEIGVQYGTDSSKIEFISSTSKELCTDLEGNIGKTMLVKYDAELIVIRTNQREQILKYQVME